MSVYIIMFLFVTRPLPSFFQRLSMARLSMIGCVVILAHLLLGQKTALAGLVAGGQLVLTRLPARPSSDCNGKQWRGQGGGWSGVRG